MTGSLRCPLSISCSRRRSSASDGPRCKPKQLPQLPQLESTRQVGTNGLPIDYLMDGLVPKLSLMTGRNSNPRYHSTVAWRSAPEMKSIER